jgi:hypothetical protein
MSDRSERPKAASLAASQRPKLVLEQTQTAWSPLREDHPRQHRQGWEDGPQDRRCPHIRYAVAVSFSSHLSPICEFPLLSFFFLLQTGPRDATAVALWQPSAVPSRASAASACRALDLEKPFSRVQAHLLDATPDSAPCYGRTPPPPLPLQPIAGFRFPCLLLRRVSVYSLAVLLFIPRSHTTWGAIIPSNDLRAVPSWR